MLYRKVIAMQESVSAEEALPRTEPRIVLNHCHHHQPRRQQFGKGISTRTNAIMKYCISDEVLEPPRSVSQLKQKNQ
jgi:hypothetical protein